CQGRRVHGMAVAGEDPPAAESYPCPRGAGDHVAHIRPRRDGSRGHAESVQLGGGLEVAAADEGRTIDEDDAVAATVKAVQLRKQRVAVVERQAREVWL